MKMDISMKYAYRSLVRHPRRTILSVIGIGLGCAVCLFIIGWVGGEGKMMLKAAAQSGVGHLRIAPAKWLDYRDNDLRLPEWESIRETIVKRDDVVFVTPRARTEALLGFGTRTTGLVVVGVDPESERAANRLVRNVEGSYLKPGETGTVVIGKTVAKTLRVELDDELMITVSGQDGEMSSAMLRIVGISNSGSRDLDSMTCHVLLSDVAKLTGRPGAAELTILVEDSDDIEDIAEELSPALPKGTVVLSWAELMPELASGVEVDETFSKAVIAIVMIVVFLGIASAQLAAVLERRKEFAVLSALGMRGRRLIAIMCLEGVVLGVVGGVAGLLIGVPTLGYVATFGVDFTRFMENADLTVSNILIDPIYYPDFGTWVIPYAFILSMIATLLSSLYPAWFALRTNPANALRVEQ